MTLKRILIALTVVMVTAVGCAYVLIDHRDVHASNARRAYIKGEHKVAHRRLSESWTELPPPLRHLYRAYIHREEGLLKASDQHLQRALAVCPSRRKPELAWEIHLGLALNAFLEDDVHRGSVVLAEASPILPDHSYTLLLKGMEALLGSNYAKAYQYLSEPPLISAESDWLNHMISEHFSDEWQRRSLARCLIENGEHLRARKLLEDLRDKQASRLYSLSFLREGYGQSPEQALTTYSQAAPSLELAKEMLLCAKRFIKKTSSSDLFTKGILFFSSYSSSPELAKLTADRLCARIEWAPTLEAMLHHETFRFRLSEELEKKLTSQLANREQSLLLWNLTKQFAPEPKSVAKRISNQIQELLLSSIREEPESSREYLQFWQELQTDRTGYPTLASALVDCSLELWWDPHKQQKGFELMILAESLLTPSERGTFRQKVAAVLKQAYKRAKEFNDLEILSLVHRAARYFRVEALEPNQEGEAANQVADATYFLSTGNYREAERRAKWVVQMDPEHLEAHRILGISYYAQGQYNLALMELGPLPQPDLQIREITGICHLLAGNPEEGAEILHTLAQERMLADRSYLLLGYHYLSREEIDEGARWLTKIRYKESEVCALLALSARHNQNYTLALDYLSQCDVPYLSHPGVKSLAALCHLALHQPDKAQKALARTSQQKIKFSDLFEQLFTLDI